MNQSIVTRLMCKVNSTASKIPWTKLWTEVANEYNKTPHSITKFPPAYLFFVQLPYDSPLKQDYYPPVNEDLKIAKERTNEFQLKSKKYYDPNYVDPKFEIRDLVIYEEFHYPNTRKLSQGFSGPYEILNKLSGVSFEINRQIQNRNTEIFHVSKIRPYYPPGRLKLSHEKQQQTNDVNDDEGPFWSQPQGLITNGVHLHQ